MLLFTYALSFDVVAWVKNNPSDSDKQKASQSGSGLKVAGSDPNKQADEGVGVMMAMDKDEFTRKQERDAEAEVKRQQNALPAWHLKSTITGDLTALGVKEHARTEVGQSSNDDILKGLGVIGGRQEHPVIHVSEDIKPAINREVDCTIFFLSYLWVLPNALQIMINIMPPLLRRPVHPRTRRLQALVHQAALILAGMKKRTENPTLSTWIR